MSLHNLSRGTECKVNKEDSSHFQGSGIGKTKDNLTSAHSAILYKEWIHGRAGKLG